MNAQRLYGTLQHVMAEIDTDFDGSISVDEFKKAYFMVNPLKTEQDMLDTFKQVDRDGSGSITLDELALHLGFTFKANGKLHDVVNTDNMTDEQLLELMRLESLASDIEKEKQGVANNERRKSQQQEMERKAEEARRRAMMTPFERSTTVRKLSLTSEVKIPLNKSSDVKRHATKPEMEFLDACTIGDWQLVDKMLLEGVKTNICDDKGETPLHKVARIGGSHAVVVAIELKKRGAEMDYPDKRGKTAAHYAAEYGQIEMLEWLISKNAHLYEMSLDGWTVLHEACFRGDRACIEAVIKSKQVDINALDLHHRTPLHIASYRCEEPIIELLVKHGADATIEDDRHHDAANLAGRVGRRASVEFLEHEVAEHLKVGNGDRHNKGFPSAPVGAGPPRPAPVGAAPASVVPPPDVARRHHVGYNTRH